MKLFISWSGEIGKELAKILHNWLPVVIQAIKPYFSPDDVAKGSRWSTEIARELESSQIGILIITPDTQDAPWIMFEAGALSKNIGKAKVSPILFNLDPADMKGPLVQFQAAKFGKSEMKRVLRMINSELGDSALTNDVLNSAFEMWWPKLEKNVTDLLKKKDLQKDEVQRSERNLLEELLALTRSLVQRDAERDEIEKLFDLDVLRLDVLRSVKEKLKNTTEIKESRLSQEEVKKRLKSGGNLAGANLMGSVLRDFDFSNADLRGANLVDADLTGAKFINANLTGANLERAVLSGADLKGANITYINLWHAKMKGVQNLNALSSIEFANFYGVEGLSTSDRKIVSEGNTLSLGDYGSFVEFYKNKGMSKTEISDIFLWTAHPYFESTIQVLEEF